MNKYPVCSPRDDPICPLVAPATRVFFSAAIADLAVALLSRVLQEGISIAATHVLRNNNNNNISFIVFMIQKQKKTKAEVQMDTKLSPALPLNQLKNVTNRII